jgi:hypothetical protein
MKQKEKVLETLLKMVNLTSLMEGGVRQMKLAPVMMT